MMRRNNYKVLIADDEGIVIESLSLIITRNFGDKCIIESAKTGRQVIELAERFRPDIVFMDIHMPGINGIDAIKEIKKNNNTAVFIVISAYDKFTYAKEALNLGVIEYLMKPTNKDKIISTLEKAINIVDEGREKRSNELLIKEKLSKVLPIIENGMIYSALFQEIYPTELIDFKGLLGISCDYGFVLVIQYGDLDDEGILTNPVGNSVKAQAFYPALQEITREYFPNGIIGPVMVNQVVVAVPTDSIEVTYNDRIKIIEKARKLNRKLKGHIDTDFRIGIGSVQKLEELSISYRQAVRILKQNKGKVVHIKDISMTTNSVYDYPDQVKNDLMTALKTGNLARVKTESENYIDWLIVNYEELNLDIYAKVYEILIYIENLAFEDGYSNYNFINRGNYLNKLLEIESTNRLKEYFLEKVIKLATNILFQKDKGTNIIILEAKEYISKNYYKDLSLDDVSRKVDISPYYFSKLFKEETGENFIDYLTNVRINQAKKKLKNKKASIKEICMDVGYSDPNYFSRIFKKNTGKTPTEFREQLF
ncbi:MAG: response regulator [Clostridiales bacterium]|nr:response regulator [Clostridiales bacterium]